MDTLSYKTKSANAATVDKKWIVVDAQGQVLGRLSSQIAMILRGKTKPSYTPHVDCGDNVIVLNAGQVRLTGQKEDQKQYIRHTGYPGGQRILTARQVRDRHPIRLIEYAVKGMLPKNRLGSKLFGNLYVYEGSEHPHEGQNPETLNLSSN